MKLLLIYAIFASAMVSGCSHSALPTAEAIVGTWTSSEPMSPGNDYTYTFMPNGTFTFVEHAAYQSIHSHQSSSGTYTVTGDNLALDTLQEEMGIDAAAMAAIDAREKKMNPDLHVVQDKGDVPVRIESANSNFLISVIGDKLTMKDIANASDMGRAYERAGQSSSQ